MSKWEFVQLKEVLRHQKGNARSLLIDDSIEYKLCRVQVHRRGVVLRKNQFGHEIKTKKQQLCHAGDLIVAEMDAKFGGYGFIPVDLEGSVVSSHYYLYELDYSKITQEYLEVLINTDYIQNQIEAKGSTNYSSIRAWEFLEYTIPLPSLKVQKIISQRFRAFADFKNQLTIELNNQEKYVSQLKQAILQEAIAGQLTADWRKQNPMQKGNPDTDAAALLAKIKAEKQQAIADGKLKKEKPLADIAIDEIPFSIPNNWVWCRLVEIAEGFEYGSSTKSLNSGKVPVLRMGNLQNGLVDFQNLVYTNDDDEIEQYALSYGDLLFNRTNSRELVGKTSLFLCNEKIIYAGYLVRYRMLGKISFHYTNYVMNSQLHRDWCYAVKIDAIGQSNINATKLRSFPFPLPPLAEQKAIVEKVDRLMNIIDQLEQQIKHRKQLAEALMQTVLREAFE